MFEKLQEMYEEGRLTQQGLLTAVNKGWITNVQYDEIIGGKQA